MQPIFANFIEYILVMYQLEHIKFIDKIVTIPFLMVTQELLNINQTKMRYKLLVMMNVNSVNFTTNILWLFVMLFKIDWMNIHLLFEENELYIVDIGTSKVGN